MTKASLTAALAATTSFVCLISAQPPSTTSATTPTDSITVRGCVAESTGRYMLTQALLVKPVPTPVPSAAAEPVQKPPSDDQTYELLGAQVKSHVGHRVEVVGTMPSSGTSGNAPASADPARTAHPIAGTVRVKTLKMLAATCS